MLSELVSLKRKALRKGVWFKVLSHVERSIYDLTMRAVNTIKSGKLLTTIRAMVEKLKNALESPVSALTRTIGRQLATELVRLAQSWGYPEALRWASDEGFARYLAICYMNMPEYYKSMWAGIEGI